MNEFLSHSPAETLAFARSFGSQLPLNSVVCLFGDLAAGKTTFIKGVLQGAAKMDAAEVQSPTFTYLHVYNGPPPIYHFDLYRLRDIDEFLSMGFDEYFEADGICCIEWAERLSSYLPVGCIQVFIEHRGEDQRLIKIVQENHD